MQSGKLTKRLATLAVAIATSACAPRASVAQIPAEAPPPVVPGGPSALSPTTTRATEDRVRVERERVRQEVQRVSDDMVRKQVELGKLDVGMRLLASSRVPFPDTPVIISTEATAPTVTTEWTEDLKVMDKVIREEVARAGSEGPEAMGIKLTMIGREGPMYVEGAGVIFSAGVHFPLAPIGATSGNKADQPRDPSSKWERAKRELKGSSKPNEFRAISVKGGKLEAVAAAIFDQGKLDALVDALVKALPEANNIRHLKGGESVFITITGSDDGGQPVRMTLKASKADIDAVAEGKLTPEEFAKRVTRRIG